MFLWQLKTGKKTNAKLQPAMPDTTVVILMLTQTSYL